jgi:hypothetical protein
VDRRRFVKTNTLTGVPQWEALKHSIDRTGWALFAGKQHKLGYRKLPELGFTVFTQQTLDRARLSLEPGQGNMRSKGSN